MPWHTKTLDQHVTDVQLALNANLAGAYTADLRWRGEVGGNHRRWRPRGNR